MDVREKLVELLTEITYDPKLEWHDLWDMRSGAEDIADLLIAHGVTVQDNTEISEELLQQLRNAPITILQEEPTIEVVQEWISVKDKLPNDREWVLVWHTGYSTPKKAKHKDDCDPYLPIFILDGDKGLGGEVTHWMPLPKPPKGE